MRKSADTRYCALRQKKLCPGCLTVFVRLSYKLIAKSAHGKQMSGLGRLFFNVTAQPDDEIIDGARVSIFFQVPNLLQDFLARNGTAAIAYEKAQQLNLHQGELKGLLAVA